MSLGMGLQSLRSGSSNEDKHSKKKFEKKLNFYSKVKDTVVSLSAKKTIEKNKKKLRSRQKKLKAYDLSTLLEHLPDGNALQTNTQLNREPLKLNCKSKHRLLQKESARLKTVLQLSEFKTDPLGAIHQHLKNTQPPESSQKKRHDKTQKRGKKKRSKALSDNQAMEI